MYTYDWWGYNQDIELQTINIYPGGRWIQIFNMDRSGWDKTSWVKEDNNKENANDGISNSNRTTGVRRFPYRDCIKSIHYNLHDFFFFLKSLQKLLGVNPKLI